jgi:hypothetical protein
MKTMNPGAASRGVRGNDVPHVPPSWKGRVDAEVSEANEGGGVG